MIGIAAVAMTAAFTSCSKDKDFEAVSQVQLDEGKYQAAFESRYGKIDPNHDWGFGQFRRGASARTRANAGQNYPATSDGINANANEWADPAKKFGGWLVPDPLTDGQKERVKAYFQANPNLGNYDPQWRHFFVQQVYKGKTSVGANSAETVVAADNSVYDSGNMNLLTVGQNHQHINNFNGGTCSTNDKVLDNGGKRQRRPYHSDEIMLMVNIDDTSCFGYHETGSSTHHDNKWALVSAATIDAWAAEHGNPGAAVTDKWNRSFMGFDLAIKEGIQACETDENGNIIYATYDQAPESPEYAWDGEKIIKITTGEWVNVTIQHEYWTENKNVPVYKDEFKSIMGCGWLTTNENFYVGEEKVTLDQSFQVNGTPASLDGIKNAVILKEFTVDGTKYQSVINLPRIKQLVDAGYLPVKDKSLQDWIKVGKSDGYFSDWIVTLTEAQRSNVSSADVRVIVEDMQATENFNGVEFKGDFDFNDVVFDVVYDYDDTQSAIILQAAGGTLPLYVGLANGVKYEVHEAFGGFGTDQMINTGAGPNADPKTIPLGKKIDSAHEVIVTVYKQNKDGEEVEVELQAIAGRAPHKIAVPNNFVWMTEWQDIDIPYPGFSDYVTSGNANWYKPIVSQ